MFTDYHNPNDYWMTNDQYDGMTDDERIASGCLQIAAFIGMLFIALLVCLLFGSCTTTEYVTVEKVRNDTVWQNHTKHDSIRVHDSIYVKEWMKGDTVYRDVYRWHTKYIEKQVHDTVYQATHDTIPQPYPVIKVVEKQLSKTQIALMIIGGLSLMAIFVFISVKLKRFLPLR